MGSYVEPRDGQAERWLKIAAAGRLAADESALIEFLASREASASVSMAASLVDLVELLRPDVTLAQTSGPGDRQYDPARPATIAELETAPKGTLAMARTRSGGVQLWVMASSPSRQAPWLGCGPIESWATSVDLGNESAWIAELPTPVAQTPAGPVALVVSPVPLASADTLPDDVIDEVFREAFGYAPLQQIGAFSRGTTRRIADLVNERLRAQFPDETPAEPAPFVLGVDQLSDRAIDEIRQETIPVRWPGSMTEHRQTVRDVAAALAAHLRLDGPRREAEPDAATFDRNEREAWGDDPTGPASPDKDIDVSRDRLIGAALTSAAGWFGRDGLPAQASAASDVDAAARAHVVTLGGPRPVVTAFAVAISDEDVEQAFAAAITAGGREGIRAALACYAERLASRDAGGYDPAVLAPGSTVIGTDRQSVALCLHARDGGDSSRWVVTHFNGSRWDWTWHSDEEVMTDGVLVVDGATLGGQR